MKKLLLASLFCLLSIVTSAERLPDTMIHFGKTLTNTIIQQTNGSVIDETANPNIYSAIIQAPDYFDNEITLSVLNDLIKTAEFTTTTPWTKTDDGMESAYQLGDALKATFRIFHDKHLIIFTLHPIQK